MPGYNSLASRKNGFGFFLKKSMSKTASGCGRPYFSSWLYRPVPGDRKSGMPALTLMPAPHMQMIRVARPLAMRSATPLRSKEERSGGVVGVGVGMAVVASSSLRASRSSNRRRNSFIPSSSSLMSSCKKYEQMNE